MKCWKLCPNGWPTHHQICKASHSSSSENRNDFVKQVWGMRWWHFARDVCQRNAKSSNGQDLFGVAPKANFWCIGICCSTTFRALSLAFCSSFLAITAATNLRNRMFHTLFSMDQKPPTHFSTFDLIGWDISFHQFSTLDVWNMNVVSTGVRVPSI